MEPPLGFVTLRDAADIVGREMYERRKSSWLPLGWADDKIDYDAHVRDWRAFAVALQLDPEIDRVIKVIAEACEAGEIAAAYRSITGAERLDPGVWRSPAWRGYFATGTIDLDLPLVDAQGRPNIDGYTARCTREIFVRRQDLDRMVNLLLLDDGTSPTSQHSEQQSCQDRGGRPEEHDWEEARLYALKLLSDRGDPTIELNKVSGWKSKADLAKAVLEHLKSNPDIKTVLKKVPGWLTEFTRN